jgi:hypothetical protein
VSDDAANLGKKSLLVALGLAVAATVFGVALSLLAPAPPPRAQDPATMGSARTLAPDVLALFSDLAPSRQVGEARITRFSGVEDGAIRVELALAEGEPFRLEIRSHDAKSPPPVAGTPKLGIYLVGRPGALTSEVQARVATELARILAAAEARGAAVPAGLVSLHERGTPPP